MLSRRLAVCALAVCATARADDEAEAPAGFERFEVSDLTFTLRDDDFSVITTNIQDPDTAYVGTFQGRVYKTTDGGDTWTESTVIPEQKLLWTAPGSSIFFGSLRSAGPGGDQVDLIGLDQRYTFGHLPFDVGKPGAKTPLDPLANETAISAGSAGGLYVIGGSQRAPRLSQLTGSKGVPVPVLNRQKLLIDRTLRGSAINDVRADPSDNRLVFAATQNGLYKSYDGGGSWARIFAGLTQAERLALRIAPRAFGSSYMILGTLSGAYFSTDHGDNWSKILTVGGAINDVAYDRTDEKFIYLATNGGVFRSTDGGANYVPIYYSTFPTENDVRSVFVDWFDPETLYIGTERGAYVTHKARTASYGDWQALEGVQSVLAVPSVTACKNHRGHLYAQARLEQLATINYGADAPESAILESWDGGKTWRQLFVGQSDGFVTSFAMNSKDPDQLWIAWSKALHRLERVSGKHIAAADGTDIDPTNLGPPIGDVVLAALRYQGLELDEYAEHIHLPKKSSFLPRALTVTAGAFNSSLGATQIDNAYQPGAFRYLEARDDTQWIVTVWASWSLPTLAFNVDSVPMIRLRVQQMNDELRRRITDTVRRHYGEYLRMRAKLATTSPDLETRVLYQLRLEQLAAIIDLASGDYLSNWQKAHRRNAS